MYHAIKRYNLDIVKYLLSLNIFDLNANIDGEPLLFYVDELDMFKLLIKHGANMFVSDDRGNTILHTTFSKEIFEYLLRCGVDPNSRNNEGETVRDRLTTDLNISEDCRTLFNKFLQLIDTYETPIKCAID